MVKYVIARIKVVGYYIKRTNVVTCNVKFLVEAFIYTAWESECSFVDTTNRPIISLGYIGCLTLLAYTDSLGPKEMYILVIY